MVSCTAVALAPPSPQLEKFVGYPDGRWEKEEDDKVFGKERFRLKHFLEWWEVDDQHLTHERAAHGVQEGGVCQEANLKHRFSLKRNKNRFLERTEHIPDAINFHNKPAYQWSDFSTFREIWDKCSCEAPLHWRMLFQSTTSSGKFGQVIGKLRECAKRDESDSGDGSGNVSGAGLDPTGSGHSSRRVRGLWLASPIESDSRKILTFFFWQRQLWTTW